MMTRKRMEFRLQAEGIAFERFRLKAELHAIAYRLAETVMRLRSSAYNCSMTVA